MRKRKVWLGPITVQGTRSEDRRLFDEFQFRGFPQSFVAQVLDNGGHSNAVAIGTVEGAGLASGGVWWGAGYTDASDVAEEYVDRIISQSQRYVSIDGAALEDPVEEAIDPETDKVVDREEIYAAYVEAEDALMADEMDEYARIMAWLDSLTWQTRYPLTQVGRLTLLTYPCFEEAQVAIMGDEGDVDPLALLAEKVGDLVKASATVEGASLEPTAPDERPVAGMMTRLVAAGAPELAVTTRTRYKHAGPVPMPAAAYELPDLPAPTPFTISSEGWVSGHVALAEVCHRSWGDKCVLMPDSDDLANFAVGATLLDDGRKIATGVITYGGPHAPDEVGDLAEEIHRRMEDLGTQLAPLVIRRDRWGLQVAGAVHMDVPRTDLNRVIAAAPSGDWRDYLFFDQRWQRGELVLMGIHLVNTPGFLTKRSLSASGTRLVASALGAPGGCGCGSSAGEPCGCGGHDEMTAADRLVELAKLDRLHAMQTPTAR